LEEDGFQGENDLQVNLTSQVGGLHSVVRQQQQQGSQTTNIPNESEIYPNLVHSKCYVAANDTGIDYETNSSSIKRDVITLLASPADMFAKAIRKGANCNIPK
jgi:hypothetical protein